MTIDDQIKQKQQQMKELRKEQESYPEDYYNYHYVAGKIDLLNEQIAELNRAKNKRKEPEIHY